MVDKKDDRIKKKVKPRRELLINIEERKLRMVTV